jgi:hypothetical protein
MFDNRLPSLHLDCYSFFIAGYTAKFLSSGTILDVRFHHFHVLLNVILSQILLAGWASATYKYG